MGVGVGVGCVAVPLCVCAFPLAGVGVGVEARLSQLGREPVALGAIIGPTSYPFETGLVHYRYSKLPLASFVSSVCVSVCLCVSSMSLCVCVL